ncbi:NADP-dependent oxidoreductase domain-containing protein [Fimicolochytrium jonesii]|uniref:NADP-dependent oxidoreductase domain-containing protein n=1 Tax=Fimicolochytrium jonesii TaxID=1396493 RepID=UPI0022FEA901|nr:NADP-dependent oxidoreductase domain-containing protein [Fimicolochytrium jonesii]KAI8823179.1 NADP-dependent oxidoreductase domain-containing protein [Fimicolochytrium jonesii]
MQRAPEPKTRLGHYKVLGAHAGVRVSPICLGAMNFGTEWEGMLGKCDKFEAFKILDTFYDAGGNFIDTADNYQNGQSEQWIGEWMQKRNNREEMVIATKFTSPLTPQNKDGIWINHAGNSRKNLKIAVERSLKNLETDYIDLLYVHWWDYTTSVEEVMQSLNQLVLSGKVLYLGVSDTPAWIVSAANTYAKAHNLAPFVVYQGKWNVEERDLERDIIPMVKHFGMAIAPWSVLGAGRYKKDEAPAREGTPFFKKHDTHDAMVSALDSIAAELNATRMQVCIAYVIKKYPLTFPILGGRKAEYLKDNIAALELVEKLTQAHVETLEKTGPIDLGFPHNFVGNGKYEDNFLLGMSGKLEQVRI